MPPKKKIALLGSTGSIGHQTLEVVRDHPDFFSIYLLSAQNQWKLLVEQAREFHPKKVVIGDPECYNLVLKNLAGSGIDVFAGPDALCELMADDDIDIVVGAIVGFAGLMPVLRAIQNGKTIALANKEALVVAGDLLMAEAQRYNAPIIPMDSEHSAIFQCLTGELSLPEKLYITASGGPFRNASLEQLKNVTPLQALAHPTWSMGAKISVDSATLMNKGLEVIEAHWLFNMPYEKIEILVHPQSIIHSMVQFADGSVKALLAPPDMRLPIQFALSYPYRLPSQGRRYLFGPAEAFTFEQPDYDRFPCLPLALQAAHNGGNAPCVLNAANEVAVQAFLNGQLPFSSIHTVVARALETIPFQENPTLDGYILTDKETRLRAQWIIGKLN